MVSRYLPVFFVTQVLKTRCRNVLLENCKNWLKKVQMSEECNNL